VGRPRRVSGGGGGGGMCVREGSARGLNLGGGQNGLLIWCSALIPCSLQRTNNPFGIKIKMVGRYESRFYVRIILY